MTFSKFSQSPGSNTTRQFEFMHPRTKRCRHLFILGVLYIALASAIVARAQSSGGTVKTNDGWFVTGPKWSIGRLPVSIDEPCSLTETEIEPMLDTRRRIWTVRISIDEETDLQAVINCTRPGDRLRLVAERIFQPRRRLVIPWSLSINAARAESNSAVEPASITCPIGDALFIIEGASFRLSNLRIIECDLDFVHNVAAIVQGLRCRGRSSRVMRLRNVAFEGNKNRAGSSGIWIEDPECYSVSMENVTFLKNSFAEGSRLARMNELIGLQVEENHLFETLPFRDSIIRLPRRSETEIVRAFVSGNNGTFVAVENGEVNVEDSLFQNNTGNGVGVFNVSRSSISFTNTTFQSNRYREDGGALFLTSGFSAVLRSVLFFNNSARAGGTLFMLDPGTVALRYCEFRSNVQTSVERDIGGAIAVVGDRRVLNHSGILTISDCTFRDHPASGSSPVGIQRWSGGRFVIERTIFAGSSDLPRHHERETMQPLSDVSEEEPISQTMPRAGALTVSNTLEFTLVIADSLFESNLGTKAGAMDFDAVGGILNFTATRWTRNAKVGRGVGHAAINLFLETSSEINFDNCTFNQSAFEDGASGSAIGGSGKNLTMRIRNSTFQRNQGFEGGAIAMNMIKHLQIVGSMFVENFASESGGAIHIRAAGNPIEIENSFFIDNRAGSGPGGAVYVRDVAFVSMCNFERNEAVHGGAIGAQNGSENEGRRSRILGTRFVNNSADIGGALYLVDGYDLDVSESLFANNRARLAGGAIYTIVFDEGGRISVDTSLFNENAAMFGGAAFIQLDFEFSSGRREQFSDGSRVRIDNTTFGRNRASRAGGGIFTDAIGEIQLDCPAPGRTTERAQQGMVVTAYDCGHFLDNSVDPGGYGANIATTVSNFALEISFSNPRRIVNQKHGSVFRIDNWRSGDALPLVRVIALDELSQAGAVSRNHALQSSAQRSTTAPPAFDGIFPINVLADDLLPSRQIANLTSGSATLFLGSPLALPGEYKINFWTTDISDNITVVLVVRDCGINEEWRQEEMICKICDANEYNFFPTEMPCSICPDNANCSTPYIFPAAGYWSSFRCSRKIQRCINADSCKGLAVLETIEELLEKPLTCASTENQTAEYQRSLCETGYTGPLCGSCQNGAARCGAFECRECRGALSGVVSIIGATLVLVFIVLLQIRSNLEISSGSTAKLNRHRDRRVTQSASRRANIATVSTSAETRSGSPPLRSTIQTVHTIYRDRERITGWKFGQLVKITSNYLQTVSIGVSLDLSWNASVFSLLKRWEFFGGSAIEVSSFSLECLLPSNSTTPRSVIQHATVVYLLVLTFLILCVASSRTIFRDGPGFYARRCFMIMITVLYVSYFSLSRLAAAVFYCIKVSNGLSLSQNDVVQHYWGVDTSVECFEGTHLSLVFYLALPLIFFSVSFPLSLALSLIYVRERESLASRWIHEMLGVFIHGFEENFVFWDSIILFRKGLLSVVVIFPYALGGNIQGLMTVMILILFMFAQTIYSPFKKQFGPLNALENFSLLISTVTILIGVILNDGMMTSDFADSLLVVSVLVMNVGLFLFLVALLVSAKIEQLKCSLLAEGVDLPSENRLSIINAYGSFLIRNATQHVRRWVYPHTEPQPSDAEGP